MATSNNTSTLRSKGISIVNCTGNQTMYSSAKPFLFGPKRRPAPMGSNNLYQIIKAGQFATLALQPYTIEIN